MTHPSVRCPAARSIDGFHPLLTLSDTIKPIEQHNGGQMAHRLASLRQQPQTRQREFTSFITKGLDTHNVISNQRIRSPALRLHQFSFSSLMVCVVQSLSETCGPRLHGSGFEKTKLGHESTVAEQSYDMVHCGLQGCPHDPVRSLQYQCLLCRIRTVSALHIHSTRDMTPKPASPRHHPRRPTSPTRSSLQS